MPESPGPGRLRGSRPRYEVAEIFRRAGPAYRREHRLPPTHHKVMRAIESCRTAVLGGHLERCDHCDYERPAYNSCRNRHCPKCQAMARAEWLECRRAELLPVPYFHAVFTLPHDLNPIARRHPALVYNLLFHAVNETLQQLARDPRHGLGGRLGFTAVLHTWDQQLRHHIHLHCLIPAGVLALDGSRWIPARRHFLFPVRVLSALFRGKFLHAFAQSAASRPGLHVPARFGSHRALVAALWAKDWIVYCRPPFDGPAHTLDYLGRYTHRVAIGNHRISAFDGKCVSIRCRDDKRTGRTRTITLDAQEFIRRFLLHVLPNGSVRIRHFGFLANATKAEALTRCRSLLQMPAAAPKTPRLTAAERFMALTGMDPRQCPCCEHGRMDPVRMLPHRRPSACRTRASPLASSFIAARGAP